MPLSFNVRRGLLRRRARPADGDSPTARFPPFTATARRWFVPSTLNLRATNGEALAENSTEYEPFLSQALHANLRRPRPTAGAAPANFSSDAGAQFRRRAAFPHRQHASPRFTSRHGSGRGNAAVRRSLLPIVPNATSESTGQVLSHRCERTPRRFADSQPDAPDRAASRGHARHRALGAPPRAVHVRLTHTPKRDAATPLPRSLTA